MAEYCQTECPFCRGGIEFPESGSGESVTCPHCNRGILLPSIPKPGGSNVIFPSERPPADIIMKHVGEYYLQTVFSPVAGSDEMDTFLDTNVENEGDGRRLIRTVIVPHFERIEEETQDLMKESFRYYLTKGFDYESFWDSLDVSFSLPTDARQFFVWAWEELFPGESPQAGDLSEYLEEPDMIAQNKLRYKR